LPTDSAIIEALKDYGKELIRRSVTEAKEAAATLIYYAAIANALMSHQDKITQHSYEKLKEAYAELERRQWIPFDLKGLFRRAKAPCQQRTRKAEQECLAVARVFLSGAATLSPNWA